MKVKHVMITGASRGIGLSLAQKLIGQGIVVSNLSRGAGPAGHHFVCDMADKPLIGFQKAVVQHGPPELLVLNAGIAEPAFLESSSQQSYREHMEVNFFAAVDLTRAAIPVMPPGSHIVFIASGAAFFGIQGHGAYVASKFALRGFAEAMRGELKPKNIHVSIVYPPNTDTKMLTDEMLEISPETKAVTMAAKTVSADFVSDKILNGINKHRFEIPVGMQMALLNRWHSLIKPLIFIYIDRVARLARQKH